MSKKTKKRMNSAVLAALVTAFFGLAALRLKAQSQGFTFYGPLSRVITPNGDMLNDRIIFCFVNPADSGVVGKIYALTGQLIATLGQSAPAAQYGGCPQGGINPQAVIWDGTMNGRTVTSGVYLYEITAEGRSYTGTVLVAR